MIKMRNEEVVGKSVEDVEYIVGEVKMMNELKEFMGYFMRISEDMNIEEDVKLYVNVWKDFGLAWSKYYGEDGELESEYERIEYGWFMFRGVRFGWFMIENVMWELWFYIDEEIEYDEWMRIMDEWLNGRWY